MRSAILRSICLASEAALLLMAPTFLEGQATATLPGGPEPPRLRELICRGGVNPSPVWGISTLNLEVVENPSSDSPYGRHYVKVKMTYEPHLTLPPGSCHWRVNDPPSNPPPGVVYFDIEAVARTAPGVTATVPAYVDTTSLRRYLSDPNHFWIFYHMHPSPEGFDSPSATVHAPIDAQAMGIQFTPAPSPTDRIGASTLADERERNPAAQSQATRAGATTAEESTTVQVNDASPAEPAVSAAADSVKEPAAQKNTATTPAPVRLRMVGLRQTERQVAIEFQARPNASPVVEYSMKAPFRRAGRGSWTFETPRQAAVRERRSLDPGRYVASAREGLIEGKRYYFVITVPAGAGGGKAQQYKGEFTTSR